MPIQKCQKAEEHFTAIYASGYTEKAKEIVKAYLDSLEN